MDRSVSIFDHDEHVAKVAAKNGFTGSLAGNQSCAVCHRADEPRGRETAKACVECHAEDMRMPKDGGALRDVVPGYAEALHGSCVRCHEERAKEAGIEAVAFDRGGFKYHGRVKALADAARESGLNF